VLIGDHHEAAVRVLEDAWAEVVATTAPRLVSITGEPGMGKTRIVQEFYRRLMAREDPD
jgi:predicted ATPase